MKQTATVLAMGMVLTMASATYGALIINADVEPDGDWTNTASSWDGSGYGGLLVPGHQEGSWALVMSQANSPSISQTFTGQTLEPGTYTVQFALGNYSNNPFLQDIAIDFTGMDLADAFEATTPTPASGGWEVWTLVWAVAAADPNLGNPLSFMLSVDDVGTSLNGAFDGVGNLLGGEEDGFLVSFDPIPEPVTMALLALGAVAGLVRRRRR